MGLVDEIKENIAVEDEMERMSRLAQLSFQMEFDKSLTTDDLTEAVSLLIAGVIKQESPTSRDDLFNTIDDVVSTRKIGPDVDWEPLVSHMDQFAQTDLVWILPLLGDSKNKKYLPLLEKYKDHQTDLIREYANEAIYTIINV